MRNLSWKWVGVGAILIFGLYQGWSWLLAVPLGGALMGSMGIIGGAIVFTCIIGLLSYFLGGVIIGRLSPGITIPEPAVASVIAILADLTVTVATRGYFPGALGILLALTLGLGLGYLGGKVGEMWQDRSRPRKDEATSPNEAPEKA